MCRLLFASSTEPLPVQDYFVHFQSVAKNNPGLSGDLQEDGWGLTYTDQNGSYVTIKNTQPIWDCDFLDHFEPNTTSQFIMAHARSKSFDGDVVDEQFNQPFIDDDLAFMFNGEISKIKIPLVGINGADKVFALVKRYYDKNPDPLGKVRDQIKLASESFLGSNVIFSDKKHAYALCSYTRPDKDYYTLWLFEDTNTFVICSNQITELSNDWKRFNNGETKKIQLHS